MPIKTSGSNKLYSWAGALLFCLSVIVVSNYLAKRTLMGHWPTAAFGHSWAWNWDPEGAYLGAGLSAFEKRYVAWIGHPGVPVIALVQAASRLLWLTDSVLTGRGASFYDFVANNYGRIILISKNISALVGAASVAILYFLALKLTENKKAAFAAAGGYFLNYTYLMYFNKVTPEHFLTLFAMGALYATIKSGEIADNHHSGLWLCYPAAAGILTAAAFCTKVMLAFPLIVFVGSTLIFQPPIFMSTPSDQKHYSRFFPVNGIIFLAVFLISVFIIGNKVQWSEFFRFWFTHAPGKPSYNQEQWWGANLLFSFAPIIINLTKSLLAGFLKLFMPGTDSFAGIWAMVSLPHLILGMSGIIFMIRRRQKHTGIIWLSALTLLLLPIAAYRKEWHYMMLSNAIMAIPAGYILWTASRKIGLYLKLPETPALLTMLVAVNALGLIAAADLKINDASEYLKWKPYYNALEISSFGEKIVIVEPPPLNHILGHALTYADSPGLKKAFENKFIARRGDDTGQYPMEIRYDSKGGVPALKINQ